MEQKYLHDKKYADISGKYERSKFSNLVDGALRVIYNFQLRRNGKKGETLVIVTDNGVEEIVRDALYVAGHKTAGYDFRMKVTKAPVNHGEPFEDGFEESIAGADAILLATSRSRTHTEPIANLVLKDYNPKRLEKLLNRMERSDSKHCGSKSYDSNNIERLQERAKKIRGGLFGGRSRVISITQAKPSIFLEGAAKENFGDMREIIKRFYELYKDAVKVFVTDKKGTNLELVPAKIFYEDGNINKPGTISNFPFGEVGGGVRGNGTNGTYVADGFIAGITNGHPSEPVKFYIKDGIVTRIEGGNEARELEGILRKEQGGNPFKVAEFSFGMNSMAYRMKGNKRILPPTSLEAEKSLGTVHLAVGSNASFVNENDVDYNQVPIHLDHVCTKPTVKIKYQDGRIIKIMKGGRLLV